MKDLRPEDRDVRRSGLRLVGRSVAATSSPLLSFLVLNQGWMVGPVFTLCVAIWLFRSDDWIEGIEMAVAPERWQAAANAERGLPEPPFG